MKRPDRDWMYKRLDGKRLRSEFVHKVDEFLKFACAQQSFKDFPKIKCPCIKCENVPFYNVETVKSHLHKRGFCPDYYRWTYHGEEFVNPVDPSGESTSTVVQSNANLDMVMDSSGPRVENSVENRSNVIEEVPFMEAKEFFDMLRAAEKPLYNGCRLSLLSMAARITSLRCEFNIPYSAVDDLASLVKDICPDDNMMIEAFQATKKLASSLELPHQEIDVCPNGCMLYWKGDISLERCSHCHTGRYRKNSEGTAKKVLIYFPITPRLQRLYATKSTAEQMRWHLENRRVDGSMAHPCDGEAWKNFDAIYSDFAAEPRNIRLGLGLERFSPVGKSSKQYSCWPVILTPYNLPPWLCMKRPFMFLSLIIPGPKSPKGKLDVYLQPLVEELQQLWDVGAMTYDTYKKQNFNMRAAVMWTVSDFSTYGMLSGWRTFGRLACPYCMENTKSFTLEHGHKHTWFDCHRQFLPNNHDLRKNKDDFLKNRVETSQAPPRLTGDQLWECLSSLPDTTDGGDTISINGMHNWTKQSIFWRLPYWRKLLVRHNLDIMQIEKNIFHQLISTLMDVKGKTKDNATARRDIAVYCKRRKLHLRAVDMGNGTVRKSMPKAPYVLTKEQRKVLCEWIQHLKFPDDYASNLSRRVDLQEYKLMGMNTHDCHVFMERLLPVALRELLPANVWKAITEVSQFFRDISCSVLQTEDMIRLENNIPEILCKLEKIFPPAFFSVMLHLPIHLPYEAKVGGPVQYRWIYPFKRFLRHLKRKVGFEARVESSICNAYLVEEVSNFCTHYLEPHLYTKAGNMAQNVGKGVHDVVGPNIPEFFSYTGHATTNGETRYLDNQDCRVAHGYVLANCELLRKYEEVFEQEMIKMHPHISVKDIWSKFENQFPEWFKQYVLKSDHSADDIIKTLARGPSRVVRRWDHYSINGYNFHTYAYGKDKSSMNYGVCVKSYEGMHSYGILQDVIELVYAGANTCFRTILFKCDWMDSEKGMKEHEQYKLVEVNHTMKYPKYDPFVFAYLVQQVYFAPYPSTKNDRNQWWAVLKVKAKSAVDTPVDQIAFQEDLNENPPSLSKAEQGDEVEDEDEHDEEDVLLDQEAEKEIEFMSQVGDDEDDEYDSDSSTDTDDDVNDDDNNDEFE